MALKGGGCVSFWQKVLKILDASMETPQPYGWFHLMWFAISILAAVVLCVLYKQGRLRNVRMVVFVTAILVALLEIYKQINYTFGYENGIEAHFQWYAFPWQFCSMPMYVGLAAGLTRGKVQKACYAFLGTYAVFAGVMVMFIPTSVFIETIGINIQTMVCHGSMITIGVFLLYTGYAKVEQKTILRALPVFAVAAGVAMVINWIAHHTSLMGDGMVNAFYFCPDCEPHLPVFSLVQPFLPGFLDVVVYIAGFTLASYLVLLGAIGVKTLYGRLRAKAVAV